MANARARKATALKDPMTKTQLLTALAEDTGLSKKDVASVLDGLSDVVSRHLKKRAAGQFTLHGLLKIKTVKKPATKARKGINHFTVEETMFKAKPARTMVKVQPLKALKGHGRVTDFQGNAKPGTVDPFPANELFGKGNGSTVPGFAFPCALLQGSQKLVNPNLTACFLVDLFDNDGTVQAVATVLRR